MHDPGAVSDRPEPCSGPVPWAPHAQEVEARFSGRSFRGRHPPGEKPASPGRCVAGGGNAPGEKPACPGRSLPKAPAARRKAAFSVSFSYPVAIALRLMLRIATSTLQRNEKGPLRPPQQRIRMVCVTRSAERRVPVGLDD